MQCKDKKIFGKDFDCEQRSEYTAYVSATLLFDREFDFVEDQIPTISPLIPCWGGYGLTLIDA